ncbi:ABC transporter ATP-binding protein [Virgibacillus sp. W0181]|uniref:ABC transporter ATP-binding protein n=1 Tax=Virgibacillus sp. W0181 TaxID=3391581 RepID=UPI003F44CEF9
MSDNDAILSLDDVTISFGSGLVLKGIDLTVNRGEIIGYIGPNGAGKSTTLKIILGLINEYQGTVNVFGEDISSGNDSYKHKIGYVPENAELYDNLTANEYLTFSGELYGMESTKAASKAERLMREFGLEDVLHSKISSFSKGMRQKVLLISSLLHDPELLFLDEPLSGLDANSVIIIKEMLEALAAKGKTIFYSSHIMEVVEKISNRIVLLADGRIIADGSFEELRKQSKEGSLEQIFNQLTGFDSHQETAKTLVQIISEEA